MVAILLLILKIIGILLLILLGLALVFILLLLFYPLRYRLAGEIPDMEHRRICLKVQWLLCVARFSMMLDETNEPQMRLRIFGIPVWRSPEKNPGKSHRSRRKEDVQSNTDNSDGFIGYAKLSSDEDTNSAEAFDPFVDEDDGKEAEYDMQTQEIDFSADDQPTNLVKKIWNKIRSLWQRIRSVFRFIRSLPERGRSFTANLHRKSQNLGRIIKDENNRQAFGLLWAELLSLLKRYSPKRVCADVDFGTNDPAMTGQILAVLSMMPFLFGGNIAIRPDFESEQLYVKGTFDIRGRIQTCHVIGSLIRLYKDKHIKRLLRQLRK